MGGPPPLLLDACVFSDRDFSEWLEDYHGRKVIPTVAYTELCYYLSGKKGWSLGRIRGYLLGLGIEIIRYSPDDADRIMPVAVQGGDFKQHKYDYMIASHGVFAPWIMVTNNIDHFYYLGSRVKTPREVKRIFGRHR